MTALLPCPHCGAPAFDFGGDLCGCSKRCFGTYLMSYEKWNRRAPVRVDDAMVERACLEYIGPEWLSECTPAEAKMDRDAMRAALEAAMNKGAQ